MQEVRVNGFLKFFNMPHLHIKKICVLFVCSGVEMWFAKLYFSLKWYLCLSNSHFSSL